MAKVMNYFMAKYTKFSVQEVQNNLSIYCDFVMISHVRTPEANFWGGRHTRVRRNTRYDSCLWIVKKYIERKKISNVWLLQMEEWNSILGIMKDKLYASVCYLRIVWILKKTYLCGTEKNSSENNCELLLDEYWISTKIVINNQLQMNKNASSSESSYYLSGGQ